MSILIKCLEESDSIQSIQIFPKNLYKKTFLHSIKKSSLAKDVNKIGFSKDLSIIGTTHSMGG